jgi:hypothetical protein
MSLDLMAILQIVEQCIKISDDCMIDKICLNSIPAQSELKPMALFDFQWQSGIERLT